MKALQTIQQKLKAPKSQYNSFGKYHYRNQEDILEAVKPLLTETNSVLTISDEIVEIGGTLFVKATVTLTGEQGATISTAYAMHAKEQKGMNEAQITGAASSYARKYALNGLFLIDDTKDADATNDGTKIDKKPKTEKPPKSANTPTPPSTENKVRELDWLNPGTDNWNHTVKRIKETKGSEAPVTVETIKKHFRLSKANEEKLNQETA
jgi:hypothetical protein